MLLVASFRSPSDWKWILNSNWKHNHEHGRRGERKALPSRLGNMAKEEKEKSSNLLNRFLTGTLYSKIQIWMGILLPPSSCNPMLFYLWILEYLYLRLKSWFACAKKKFKSKILSLERIGWKAPKRCIQIDLLCRKSIPKTFFISRILHRKISLKRPSIDSESNSSSFQDNKQPNQQNVSPSTIFIFISIELYHQNIIFFWLNHARDLCVVCSVSIKSDILQCVENNLNCDRFRGILLSNWTKWNERTSMASKWYDCIRYVSEF